MFENVGMGGIVLYLAVIVLLIVSMWKVFEKAGKPGWGCLIPIYNLFLLIQIARKPEWWILLYLVPLVNIVVAVMVVIGVAENFGKSQLFGIGLFFFPFICYPILAFGDARYQG